MLFSSVSDFLEHEDVRILGNFDLFFLPVIDFTSENVKIHCGDLELVRLFWSLNIF